MFNPAEFRDLVSGRRKGPAALLLRAGLGLLAAPYAAAVSVRNRRYDRSHALIHRAAVPVISVGNITAGGSGKTPLVEWLARWFRQRGVRVTIISRGYGAEAGAKNDEALELEEKLPDVPHLQNPNRVEAAHVAVEELECELILLDDGFQHRRLHRDLNLVLIDATEPFGYGHVLPRGLLREPLAGLARADVICLSRADVVDAARREQIREQVKRYAPQAGWCELAHAPRALLSCGGAETPLDSLAGKKIAAFCGIGNPAGFRHTLAACGYEVAEFREFADHHAYSREDVDSLNDWISSLDVAAAVCTHKDLVKLRLQRLAGQPLYALTIGIEILAGRNELDDQLTKVLATCGERRAESGEPEK